MSIESLPYLADAKIERDDEHCKQYMRSKALQGAGSC
jgi:hypothetical protein